MTSRRYPEGAEPAFCRAVELTLTEEGVFSDHSWDPGGATKFGVTFETAARHELDVETLTIEEAVYIYWYDYWRVWGFHELESWHVAAECFDTTVNAGPGASARIAQSALVHNRFDHVAIDGRWGPQTRGALNRASERYERNLLAALNGEQYIYYHSLRHRNPELHKRAIRGWMKRVWPELPEIHREKWERAAETGRAPERRAA